MEKFYCLHCKSEEEQSYSQVVASLRGNHQHHDFLADQKAVQNQLFARFDVDRGLLWDKDRGRVAWDATAPIPSADGPIPARRWPAVTLHDPEILKRVSKHAEEDGLLEWEWPSNILM